MLCINNFSNFINILYENKMTEFEMEKGEKNSKFGLSSFFFKNNNQKKLETFFWYCTEVVVYSKAPVMLSSD